MYEHLAAFGGGEPRQAHHKLYKEWSKGDWGMIMTGNVQVQKDHLSLGRDMVIPSPTDASYSESLHSFRLLSETIRGHNEGSRRPLAIMQLNHTGRQSPRIIGGRHLWQEPVAPSNLPLGSNSVEGWFARCVYRLLFQRPRPLEESEVVEVVEMFKKAALFAAEAGFDGVEVHASHGCTPFSFFQPSYVN
jgi:2,4-dienoyl-CoA reductase-like NADH-dependent reductase (Old Yellow Enzyme family)